jgi:hypothetical protein
VIACKTTGWAYIPVFPDYCLIFSGGYRGQTVWQVYLWTRRICTDSLHRHLPKIGRVCRRSREITSIREIRKPISCKNWRAGTHDTWKILFTRNCRVFWEIIPILW